jgi:hypothetical protein
VSAGAAGRRGFRIRPVGAFWFAFLLLLGAAASVAAAQFTGSRLAPWISMGLSAGAVIFALVALTIRAEP